MPNENKSKTTKVFRIRTLLTFLGTIKYILVPNYKIHQNKIRAQSKFVRRKYFSKNKMTGLKCWAKYLLCPI